MRRPARGRHGNRVLNRLSWQHGVKAPFPAKTMRVSSRESRAVNGNHPVSTTGYAYGSTGKSRLPSGVFVAGFQRPTRGSAGGTGADAVRVVAHAPRTNWRAHPCRTGRRRWSGVTAAVPSHGGDPAGLPRLGRAAALPSRWSGHSFRAERPGARSRVPALVITRRMAACT